MNRENLNLKFEVNKIDAIISMNDITRLWLTGLKATFGVLLILPKTKKAILYVDSRYIEEAKSTAINCIVKQLDFDLVKKDIENLNIRKIGIESNYLTIDQLNFWKSKLDKDIKFINLDGQDFRVIKSKQEIKKIQEAINISLKAFNFVKNNIKPGLTEIEVAKLFSEKIKELGASKESFDTIVASGVNGSKPHAEPTNKKIKEGEFITMDFGVMFEGYASDITRTFKVGNTIKNPKLEEIYEIVKTAQKKGIESIKPGIQANKIDEICREYIKSKGYERYFQHGTGHGLGIEVHEKPYLSKKDNTILKPGMIVTVEPGIYIEKLGGVRIEDDILITKKGYKILSK